jgi:hypothetical protein
MILTVRGPYTETELSDGCDDMVIYSDIDAKNGDDVL